VVKKPRPGLVEGSVRMAQSAPAAGFAPRAPDVFHYAGLIAKRRTYRGAIAQPPA